MCGGSKSSSTQSQTTQDNRSGVAEVGAGAVGVSATGGASVTVTNSDAQAIVTEVLDLVRDLGAGVKELSQDTIQKVTDSYQPPQNVGQDEIIKSGSALIWPAAIAIGAIVLLKKGAK